jgi:hypothetical protein
MSKRLLVSCDALIKSHHRKAAGMDPSRTEIAFRTS